VRVGLPSKLQNLLCRQIDVGWNHSKHDGPRVIHVAFHHVSHNLNVRLRRHAVSGTLEDAWNVDDTEVLLIRARDLKAKDVIRECGPPLRLSVVSGQAHFPVRLWSASLCTSDNFTQRSPLA
jgi:hypothetical protein